MAKRFNILKQLKIIDPQLHAMWQIRRLVHLNKEDRGLVRHYVRVRLKELRSPAWLRKITG